MIDQDFLTALGKLWEDTDSAHYTLHYGSGKSGKYHGIDAAVEAAKDKMKSDETIRSIEIHKLNVDNPDAPGEYVMKITAGGHIVRPSAAEQGEIAKLKAISKSRAAALFDSGESVVIQPKNYKKLESENKERFRLRFKRNDKFTTLESVIKHLEKEYPDHKGLSFLHTETEKPKEEASKKKETSKKADIKPVAEAKEVKVKSVVKPSNLDACPYCGSTKVRWFVEKPEVGDLTKVCDDCKVHYTVNLGQVYQPQQITTTGVNNIKSKPVAFAALMVTAEQYKSKGMISFEAKGSVYNEYTNLSEAVIIAQRFANDNNTNVKILVEPQMLKEVPSADVKTFGVLKPIIRL